MVLVLGGRILALVGGGGHRLGVGVNVLVHVTRSILLAVEWQLGVLALLTVDTWSSLDLGNELAEVCLHVEILICVLLAEVDHVTVVAERALTLVKGLLCLIDHLYFMLSVGVAVALVHCNETR